MARSKISLSSLLDEVSEVSAAVEPLAAEPPKSLSIASSRSQDEPATSTDAERITVETDAASAVPAHSDESAEDAPADDLGGVDLPALELVAAKSARTVEARASRQRSATPVGSVKAIKAAPPPPPLPLYLELTRKEARFRQDQLNDLTTLTRQLNRRRGSTGERITDNTLIRVAVDMMLKVADALDGATESELLDAVSARFKR